MKWFICMIIIGCGHGLTAMSYDTNTPYTPTEVLPPIYGGYCLLGNDRVCGTNGFENFLFDNACELNTFNGKQISGGHPVLNKTDLADCYPSASAINYKPLSYCPQFCNRVLAPVCASYLNVQRNFTNECILRRYICDTQQNWQIVLNGTCVDASCSMDGQEVCAWYDHVQYEFPNLMSLYADIKKTGRNWHILNVGPCPCPTEYLPVCAQVNCTVKTYHNECFLKRDVVGASYWDVLFVGECPLQSNVPSGCNSTTTTTSNPNDTTPTTIPTTTPTTIPTTTPTTTPTGTPTETPTTTPTTGPTTTPATTPPSNSTTPADNSTTTTTALPPTGTTPASNITTTTSSPPTSTTSTPVPANCTAGPNIIPIPAMSRPVYVVRQNKILPYQPTSYVPKYGKNTYSPSAPSSISSGSYGGASISVYSSDSYHKPAAYISSNSGVGIYTTPKPNNLVYVQTITSNGYNSPEPTGSSGYPLHKTKDYNYANMKPKNYAVSQNIGYNPPISSGYSNLYSYSNNPANSSGFYSISNSYGDMPANGPASYSGIYSPSKSNNYPAADTAHSNVYKATASSGYSVSTTSSSGTYSNPNSYGASDQNNGYQISVSSGPSYDRTPSNTYVYSNTKNRDYNNGYTPSKTKSYEYSPPKHVATYSQSKSSDYTSSNVKINTQYSPSSISSSSYSIKITPSYAKPNYKYSTNTDSTDDDDDDDVDVDDDYESFT